MGCCGRGDLPNIQVAPEVTAEEAETFDLAAVSDTDGADDDILIIVDPLLDTTKSSKSKGHMYDIQHFFDRTRTGVTCHLCK